MPELPEVETMRRGVAGATGGCIEAVEFVRTRAKPISVSPARAVFRRKVVGRRIESVDRIGKRVVLMLEGGSAVVIEPRMTGLVLVADPPTQEHLRVRFELSGGAEPQLQFWDRRGLGTLSLFSKVHLQELRELKLGPDALLIDAEDLRERLRRSRREIKPALLDQAAVAGIGNLYAAEILHVAGIHPARRCNRMTIAQWRRLQQAMVDVLEAAIRYEGSTLGDGTYRNALNKAGGYQNEHRVYAKAGETCTVCRRGVIERFVQSQRATFFCPVCQPRTR